MHNPAHRADEGTGRHSRLAPSAPQSHRPHPTAGRRRGFTALTCLTAVVASGVALTAAITSSGVLAHRASAGELVANGTFETSTSAGSPPRRTTATPPVRVTGGHTGSYAAKVSNTSSAAATTVLNDSPNTVASTTAGLTYRATAWVRASQANTSLGLRLMEYTSSNALVTTKQAAYWATDTAWHQLSVDLVAAKAGSSLDVNALAWDLGAGKSFLVDDVSVQPVTSSTPAPPPVPAGGTAPPAGVLPAQGSGTLFGYYPDSGGSPSSMETTIGRKFDLIHHFKDFDATNNMWPTSAMLPEASGGRTIHIGWELVSYGGGYDPNLQPAPGATSTDRSGKVQKTWTYKQVSSGSLDRYLDAVAAKVKATSAKFIVDIDPETDDRPDIGGTNKIKAVAGTRAEYVAAYRHIVDRFRAQGVTNILWSWTMSGWTASDPSKAWNLQQLWPGSNYVNMIMWDPYNHSTSNWRSFSQLVAPFYNAIRGGLLDPVDANAKKLPLGLGEYGCIADSRRPAWFKAIPSQIRSFPALVSIGYFNSGSWGSLGLTAPRSPASEPPARTPGSTPAGSSSAPSTGHGAPGLPPSPGAPSHATSRHELVSTASPLLLALDLAGTFAFALNGALTAIRVARLDVVGVVTLGMVTALGGGVIRDVFLDALPPATFSDWRYLAVAATGSLVAFLFARRLDRWMNPILVLDAAGLSLFAVSGALKAMRFGVARCRR